MNSLNIASIFSRDIQRNDDGITDIIGIGDSFEINDDNKTDLWITVLVNGEIKQDAQLIFTIENEDRGLELGQFSLEKVPDAPKTLMDFKYVFRIQTPFPETGEYEFRGYLIPKELIPQDGNIDPPKEYIIHTSTFNIFR